MVLLLLFVTISCKNVNNNKIIEIDYQQMITQFDLIFGMDLNNPKKTMDDLNTFITSNYSDLKYVYENKYILQLNENDSTILIKSPDIFDRTNIPLNMNLNKKRFDYCQNSNLLMTGYFSNKFKALEHSHLLRLNKNLKKSFNDSIYIPVYSKKNIEKANQNAMFKYKEGEIFLLCSLNFPNKELLEQIQDSLLSYLRQDNVGFDYALIPIEKN
jgi:hypothetical protein